MADLQSTLAPVRHRLTRLVQENNGPGASVAVAQGSDVFTAAAGIANVNTGLPVTEGTRFLIGSNTKAMTITLMCRAADDGLIDLDERVLSYLPEFKTADQTTTEMVTIRNILLHNSGIGGDFFRDFGRGDDAIARLVEALPEAGVAHPVGMTWAYSNAAYVVAGRILEVVHGKPYAQILRERLLDPLGMNETSLLPEDSILHPTAVGHVPAGEQRVAVTPTYLLPHAMAPAGAIVNSTASDMVRFGRMILDGGVTASGERLLTEKRLAEMLTPAIPIPRPLSGHFMTLLMVYEEVEGRRRYLSSGGTTGQTSFFFLLPDHDVVLVGLTNGPGSVPAVMTVFDEITKELTGWDPLPAPEPSFIDGVDLDPYQGTYESPAAVIKVTPVEGELELEMASKGDIQRGQVHTMRLRPIGDDEFMGDGAPRGCKFFEIDGGKAAYLWMHSVYRRTA